MLWSNAPQNQSSLMPSGNGQGNGSGYGGDNGQDPTLRVLAALSMFSDFEALTHVLGHGNPYGIEVVNWCKDGLNVVPDALQYEVDAVILDPEIPNFNPQDIQKLYYFEKKPIVCIGAVPPYNDWAQMMHQMGAKAHVARPINEETARKLIAIINGQAQEALRQRASPSYIPQIDSRTAQVLASRGWRQTNVVVWGPKGGVGKTTIACNLAAALGVLANRTTVLVDANMTGGNDHHHYHRFIAEEELGKNISALADKLLLNSTIAPLDQSAGMLSARALVSPLDAQSHLFPYPNSNLGLLVGIPRQHMGGRQCFAGEQGRLFVRELLSTLRQFKDFVILDIGQDANIAVHLAALEYADLIYVVVTPDRSSIISTQETLETLFKHVQLNREKFRLIINRFDPANGISRPEIVKWLKMPEVAVIPDGGAAVMATSNRGYPLVIDSRGQVAESIVMAASTLYPPIRDVWHHRGKLSLKPQRKSIMQAIFG
jgi:Flp pilus assembly CpaE family ATPase